MAGGVRACAFDRRLVFVLYCDQIPPLKHCHRNFREFGSSALWTQAIHQVRSSRFCCAPVLRLLTLTCSVSRGSVWTRHHGCQACCSLSGLCILKERDGVFFVGGVMPGSKAAALNAVHIGDVVASVDGRVLSSSSSVEDAVRMIDEPYGSGADVLLLRDVPRAGLLHVQLSFVRVWKDHAEDVEDKEHDDASLEEGHATKFSPRSFGSTSSSFSTSRGRAAACSCLPLKTASLPSCFP